MDIQTLTAQVEKEVLVVAKIQEAIRKNLVGQSEIIERMLLGLLVKGHILVEGLPGLAKTTAVRALAQTVNLNFHRVQFTPDLLPSDLIGTQVYRPKEGDFVVKKGPIFYNLVLADEINRAPAKVQSALLEAMQERQVTIGDASFQLPSPFLVMATQNPIEQEGTYPLPEAQVDRFMMKLKIDYPTLEEEKTIMKRLAKEDFIAVEAVTTREEIQRLQALIPDIYMDEKIENYLVTLVQATRKPEMVGLKNLSGFIQYGASPRASIWLARAARGYAFLQKRAYVTPQDIKTIGPDVLRHRIGLSYEAEADQITTDEVIRRIFDHVEVP